MTKKPPDKAADNGHDPKTGGRFRPAVLRVRKTDPTWGSKKILAVIDRERPDESWPAWLNRHERN